MSIAETCVKRPVFAVVLISFLVVLGLFSFRDLGVDLFPRADIPVVTVEMRLPGASPGEITTQLVYPLEGELSVINGLNELTATAQEGTAQFICRFALEREIEDAAQDVREKVAGALRNLPPTVLSPVIQKVDPNSEPVLSLVVVGKRSLREITEIADKQIRRALETVDGVGEVTIIGGLQRQIKVFADIDKLSAYDISIDRFQRAITDENVEIPGGQIIRGPSEMGVRTLGRISSLRQFNDIVVSNVNGSSIRLKDLGRVEDGFAEPHSWNMFQGKLAVAIDIKRQSDANTVKLVGAINKKLEQLKRNLPPDISIQPLHDQSVFINASIASLEEHLLFGSLLASIVVLFFIRNLRSVLIAAIAIPTSIISTFILLKAMNFTLNNMTLLALTLAVGIVIDDAIVVLENIVRFIEEKGYDPRTAAIEGTKEITLAVLATTLSLVIIFVPIAFMTGYARRFVNQFGWTMACAVIMSMLVSFVLTPTLCSLLFKKRDDSKKPVAGAADSGHGSGGILGVIDRSYGWILKWSLEHRAVILLIAAGTFALIFPLNSMVGRDFIPADDQNELNVVMDGPEDSSVSATADVASEIAERISKLPGVEFVNPRVLEADNHAHIYVRLQDLSKRKLPILSVASSIRGVTGGYKSLRTSVNIPSPFATNADDSPLHTTIVGPDFEGVSEVAKRLGDALATVPGLLDAQSRLNVDTPEIQVNIDRSKTSDLGVQTSDVARTVRLMIAGEDQVSSYKEGSEQYPVVVQLLPEQQRNLAVLARLMVPSTKVGQVRLDNIATLQRGMGPAKIERYNRQFQASVDATNAASLPLDAAAKAVIDQIDKVTLPDGYRFLFTGSVRLLEETTTNLVLAILLASIFMYMVLAAQFDSFAHPFTIMLSLPLAVPFALLSLWLTGRTLNLWSALGMLLLLGVVKKNGILQVDYTNKLREQGMPVKEAIIQANKVRLRPILMTTLSIVAGLIPTALGLGVGSSQRSAIAVTIIGGQSLCLLLTLVVTPVAYSCISELEERALFSRIRTRLAGALGRA